MRAGRRILAIGLCGTAAGVVGVHAGAAAPPSCFGKPATIVSGKERVVGTPRADVIVTRRGVKSVSGRAGADRICMRWSGTDADGGRGRDRIGASSGFHGAWGITVGGEGDDVLTGQFSHLRGGPGADVLKGDSLAGNAGDDLLRSTGFADVYYGTSPRPIVADMETGTVRGHGHDRIEGRLHTIFGSPHDDVLVAGDAPIRLVGGLGDDRLTGGSSIDHLYGDFLRPHPKRGGTDVIRGGPVIDVLHGGAGADRLYGEGGDDYVHGDVGNDLVHGGARGDSLIGGKGRDRLKGGAGADWVEFPRTYADLRVDLGAGVARGLGTDRLRGIENATGGNGHNTLLGDEGPNTLYGSESDDSLHGRGGDDLLWGVSGADAMNGGDDHDVCHVDHEDGQDETTSCEETPEGNP